MAATTPVTGFNKTLQLIISVKCFLRRLPKTLTCDFTEIVRPSGTWRFSIMACFKLGPAPYRGSYSALAFISTSLFEWQSW